MLALLMTSKKSTECEIKPVSDESILKVAKEIVVKFIEVGQLSPAKFGETFDDIYKAVRKTVRS